MSIAEKLVTIAENQEKVYMSGKIDTLDESKYMHPTVSGSVISVNDVNSMEHSLGVKVESKNLINTNLPLYHTRSYGDLDSFDFTTTDNCVRVDIKKDMRTIETMNISKEAKALPLKELQEQIDDIKERMHDVIDKY